jgi:hypothetical protein
MSEAADALFFAAIGGVAKCIAANQIMVSETIPKTKSSAGMCVLTE